MPTSIVATSTFALAALACLGGTPATAATYQYTTITINLNPPPVGVGILGLDNANDAIGSVAYYGSPKKYPYLMYTFSWNNGAMTFASPVGGPHSDEFIASSSSGLVSILRRQSDNLKSHPQYVQWDIATNKVVPQFRKGDPKVPIVYAINSDGYVAGEECGTAGCLAEGSTIFDFAPPGAEAGGRIYGLTDSGFVASSFSSSNGAQFFTYDNGNYAEYTVPGGATGVMVASNGAFLGNVAGQSTGSGFIILNGQITYYNYPGATATGLAGVNASGQAIGGQSTNGVGASFLFQNGTYYPLAFPGASQTQLAYINDRGTIVGTYLPQGKKNTYKNYVPFMATCASGPGTCTP